MVDLCKLARDIVFGPNEPSGVETDGVKDGDVTFRFWFVNGPARSFTARVPKSAVDEARCLPKPSARARLVPYLAEVMVSVANERAARAQRAEREAAAKKAAELAPLGSSRNPLRYVVDPSMPVGSFALVNDKGDAVFAQWPSASVERVGPGAFEVTVPAAGSLRRGRLCPSCVSGVKPSVWLDSDDGRPCGKCGRKPTSGPATPKARDWRVPPPYDSCEVRHVKHAGAYACRYHNDDVPDQWRGFEGRGDTGPDAYADYCARIKRMHPDWRHGGTPRGVAPCEHLGDLMPGSRGAAYPICGRCGAVSSGPPNGFAPSRVGAHSAAYAAEVRACKACPKRMCSRHHPRDRADALAAHPEPQGADPYALYQVEVLAEALAPFGHDPTGAAVDEALSFAEQVRTTEAALHAEKGARLDALGKAIEVVKEGSKGR
jgi:hypothetical protein